MHKQVIHGMVHKELVIQVVSQEELRGLKTMAGMK